MKERENSRLAAVCRAIASLASAGLQTIHHSQEHKTSTELPGTLIKSAAYFEKTVKSVIALSSFCLILEKDIKHAVCPIKCLELDGAGVARWFRDLIRMPSGCLALEVFQADPPGRRPWGPRWRDYISHLAWEPPQGAGEGERVVWNTLLSLLLLLPDPG